MKRGKRSKLKCYDDSITKDEKKNLFKAISKAIEHKENLGLQDIKNTFKNPEISPQANIKFKI